MIYHCFPFQYYTINDVMRYILNESDDLVFFYKIFSIEERTSCDVVNFYKADFDSPNDNPHISTVATVKLNDYKILSSVTPFEPCVFFDNEKRYLSEFKEILLIRLS